MGDVEWSLWLGFPAATAIGLTEEFAGGELALDSPDMADAIGELANMIAGDTKTRLHEMGTAVQLSLPSVVSGNKLRVRTQHDMPFELACLATQWGRMWIEVTAGVRVGQVREVGS